MKTPWIALLIAFVAMGCHRTEDTRTVVVYASVDQVHAEPVLKAFERVSGIRVLPVYDVEASKTTGLVQRLIAEKDRPRADVFWNGEFVQTMHLADQGVLASYRSPSAAGLPGDWHDPKGCWTAMGGRARVFLARKGTRAPRSLLDLENQDVPADRTAIALPLFGTTATHAATLYAVLGPARAKAFFVRLKERGVRVLDGNAAVRDQVVAGAVDLGLTDSDDALGALEKGADVDVVFPDQDNLGTLVVPETVAQVRGAPHPAEAQALIDYLLGTEVESELVRSGFSQLALRVPDEPPFGLSLRKVRRCQVRFEDVVGHLPRAQAELRELFVR